jgi:hypothetical protein
MPRDEHTMRLEAAVLALLARVEVLEAEAANNMRKNTKERLSQARPRDTIGGAGTAANRPPRLDIAG